MAPGYRNANRRQNRTGYVDHDVYEGLPVRHWRRDYVTIQPPPEQENTTSKNDIWAVELPHGMPKDSHLLPQHSQDLLRAARSGRIYKRPAPPEEEEADPEAILDKPEKKDEDPKDRGFTAKAWKQIPRHLEGPDIEYLAPRRKGLITLPSKALSGGLTMMKTKVRREDAAGNEYVEEIIAPKGSQVQGEVIAQTVVPGPTVVDTFTQPTPPKRKGAPPKKKMKGPGRGRKKKAIGPTSVPEVISIDGVAQSVEGGEVAVGPDGVKIESTENENGGAVRTANEDSEMADGSMAASDDEDGEDGDEGDDDEGSVSVQDSPSKPRFFSPVVSELPHMREIPNIGSSDTEMSGIDDLPGPPLPKIETIEGKSGSPLKNVAMTTSTLTSPVKSQSSFSDNAPFQQPPPEPSNGSDAVEPVTLGEGMQKEVAETAPTTLPPPPPEPTIADAISSAEVRQEEEEEEEMLLDMVENINNSNIGAPLELDVTTSEISAEPTLANPESQPTEIAEPASKGVDVAAPAEQLTENVAGKGDDDDEPFTDLLGGLEKQLVEPQAESAELVEAQTEPPKPIEPSEEIAEPVSEEKTDDSKEAEIV